MHRKRVVSPGKVLTVHDVLRARFRAAGHGSQRRTEKELGLYEDYFCDKRKRGVLDLGVLLATLEKLEVHPADLMVDAFGPWRPAWPEYEGGVDDLSKRAEKVIREARRRVREAGEEGRDGRVVAVDEAWIEAHDRLREDDPYRVLLRVEEGLPAVEPPWVPRVLGVFASACLVAERPHSARRACEAALELARELRDDLAAGDLLERLSSIVSYFGEYERALAVAKESTLAYLDVGDDEKIAQGISAQGIFLFQLGRFREVIRKQRRALPHLRHAPRRAVVALHSIALCWTRLGEPAKALPYLERASELSAEIGAVQNGKRLWLQGTLAAELGRKEEALRAWHGAVDAFLPTSSVNAALVSIETVTLLVEEGQVEEAYGTARNMARLVEPLREFRVAAGTVTELVRRALGGRLSKSFLDRAAAHIREEQERRRRRSCKPRGR